MPDFSIPEKFTAAEAIEIQKRLRSEIKLVPLAKPPKIIGGCDVSMDRFATEGYAGFIDLDYETLLPLSHAVVKDAISFPYIPGLLSFREIPMLVKAWKKLSQKPDVLIVDGTGILHPRRMGIAAHLGLVLGIPTIGCAKNLLTGVYTEPAIEPASISYVYDRSNKKEIIGAAVRTKRNVKPVFISPGHLITLEASLEIILHCVRKHHLPEPTRLAHIEVNRYRMEDKMKS